MKVLQINSVVNSGSTGRIAEDIGSTLLNQGHESVIAYGRGNVRSQSKTIRVGGLLDFWRHVFYTRVLDRHGFASEKATRNFIRKIDTISPDIIHLHNLHGYYLNVKILFDYLESKKLPIVWTFHDCWPFTGHCSYFEFAQCTKWKTECFSCPNKTEYPRSFFFDNSRENYHQKKALFTQPKLLTIVTPSNWLANYVKDSFLGSYPVQTVPNGIDVTIFAPKNYKDLAKKYQLLNKKVILGVASIWDRRKGLSDFLQLSQLIEYNCVIVLVGLNKDQLKNLPANILGIERTESVHELAEFYSLADVFVNPTYVDNFPTTNIESLACGTPVITYQTGGSPESIDDATGIVVEKGDLNGLLSAINSILFQGKSNFAEKCRERAVELYNKEDRFSDYIHLYESLLIKTNH